MLGFFTHNFFSLINRAGEADETCFDNPAGRVQRNFRISFYDIIFHMAVTLKKLNIADIRKLAREADVAARKTARNRFVIETYLSIREAKEEKTQPHTSARALFRKLGI